MFATWTLTASCRYCISPANRTRIREDADKIFFETLSSCQSNIPVIIVSTRSDDLDLALENEARRAVKKKNAIASRADGTAKTQEEVCKELYAEKIQNYTEYFRNLQGEGFLNLIFVAEGKSSNIIINMIFNHIH